MKIGVLTQFFDPEPVPIPGMFARYLVSAGHNVRVLCGWPNYPNGKIYDGYRHLCNTRAIEHGVHVLRVPLWPHHSTSPAGRIANYLSFAISSTTHFRFLRDADVIYVYATPPTASLCAEILRGQVPYVLHVQDLWPESILGSSMLSATTTRLADALLRPWLYGLHHHAAALVAIAPSMAAELLNRGATAEQIHMIMNPGTRSRAQAFVRLTPEESRPDHRTFRLLYAGNIGIMQDLETVMEALALVGDLLYVHLDVVGDGVATASVRNTAQRLGLETVTFHGRLPRDRLDWFYAHCDFQIITLRDLPVFRLTIPSKFQEGLALGLPVITTVRGDLADLVRAHGVGLCASSHSPEDLARAIRCAYDLSDSSRQGMSDRALALYDRTMTPTVAFSRMRRILLELPS